jgi:3-methyl-2-oxobutanoate hydroxymethyltransferase
VLVYHDLLGLSGDFRPKFVRRYAELGPVIEDAARRYREDVRSGAFPSREETFVPDAPPLRRVY